MIAYGFTTPTVVYRRLHRQLKCANRPELGVPRSWCDKI
jgi:hypothetical protein